jgi:hypothetical protein
VRRPFGWQQKHLLVVSVTICRHQPSSFLVRVHRLEAVVLKRPDGVHVALIQKVLGKVLAKNKVVLYVAEKGLHA